MATGVVNTEVVLELGPGQSATRHWNNASPAKAVWSANAIPVGASGTQFEITRLWRKGNTVKKGDHVYTEHEVHYTVKNVGTEAGKCVVWFAIVS